jgi:hypothetical protein
VDDELKIRLGEQVRVLFLFWGGDIIIDAPEYVI